MTDPPPTRPAYDPDALRERYRQEREKRLRADGSAQYRQLAEELERYLTDPYLPLQERDPVNDVVDVAVIGGGFGGLLAGARLRAAGIGRIRLVEQGGDFGGTWYWNRYPGAACDTESYIYLPLLEETGYIPTERYAKGPEIYAHCRRIAQRFDLYRDALLHTRVTAVRWSDAGRTYTLSTDRGDEFRARFVVMTAGAMSLPKLPGIPGIESFTGQSFHTSRWDYEVSGGDPYGDLTGLADKRVAVIGTGATGVQVVPHVAASAEHLYVFQRTPSAVNVRDNRPTDPDWAASLRPGWQRERVANFSGYIAGEDVGEDLVDDGWTKIFRNRALHAGVLDEAVDFEVMEAVRARVDATVTDPEVAEALKPYYRALCKRPTFHDEYLPTFNRPNVTLVDTDGKGVEKITPTAVVANGQEYEVDCIVFASGFTIGASFATRLGFDVVGRDGLTLSEKFAPGISTLFGMQTHSFPNLFIVAINQVGIASNQTHLLDVQARHIAGVVEATQRVGAATVEATTEAEERWVRTVVDSARRNAEFLKTCTPGYYNNEGHPNVEAFKRNGAYAPGVWRFEKTVEEWRSTGGFDGLLFDGSPLPSRHVAVTERTR
ncbi:flavin-containing monooxygenase [Pseudonocardia dioxanivorans]|uniref:flavin-containing monooxygenase n=1 Tax=Pseudonocardia dioxanivorans TaxID=240495 RepID=UPI000CD2ACAF|nr:NAD(P)/FAD-dependent oxidoreductase [Pseudonocardia dioxanivorans]